MVEPRSLTYHQWQDRVFEQMRAYLPKDPDGAITLLQRGLENAASLHEEAAHLHWLAFLAGGQGRRRAQCNYLRCLVERRPNDALAWSSLATSLCDLYLPRELTAAERDEGFAASRRAVSMAEEHEPHALRYLLGNHVRVAIVAEQWKDVEAALLRLTDLTTSFQRGDIQAEDDFLKFIPAGAINRPVLEKYQECVAKWRKKHRDLPSSIDN